MFPEQETQNMVAKRSNSFLVRCHFSLPDLITNFVLLLTTSYFKDYYRKTKQSWNLGNVTGEENDLGSILKFIEQKHVRIHQIVGSIENTN